MELDSPLVLVFDLRFFEILPCIVLRISYDDFLGAIQAQFHCEDTYKRKNHRERLEFERTYFFRRLLDILLDAISESIFSVRRRILLVHDDDDDVFVF